MNETDQLTGVEALGIATRLVAALIAGGRLPAGYPLNANEIGRAIKMLRDELEPRGPEGLVYLSSPFGGDPANLDRAIAALVRLRKETGLGLRLQAPWIASARAELVAGTTEAEWKAAGGLEVERMVLAGYSAILLDVREGEKMSPGQEREARTMDRWGRPVWFVRDGELHQWPEVK